MILGSIVFRLGQNSFDRSRYLSRVRNWILKLSDGGQKGMFIVSLLIESEQTISTYGATLCVLRVGRDLGTIRMGISHFLSS